MSKPKTSRALALLLTPFLAAPLLAQEGSRRGAERAAESAAQEAADAEAQEAEAPEAEEPAGRPPVDLGKPTLPPEWIDAFHWRSVGPANMGGRITDVAVNPEDRCEYWIATASGGIVHTTDNGVNYEHRFDGERTVSIGALAVAPSDPTVLYVGTGECNPRNSVSFGDGVYKSTDSGKTWTHVGLEASFQTGAVVVHPSDPNTVYVGALGRLWGPNEERGLFKTTDGGKTWEKLLYVDENTGVIDVKMSPADPETLLVATYDRRRDLFDTNDPAKKWGEGSGLHRTTDGGKSFTKVTKGLPSAMLGRIGIDFYAKDPSVVYAIVESEKVTQEPENAAWMGVSCERAEVGARVLEVTEKSPAAECGLQKGDIVVRIDDKTVLGWDQLQKKIRTSLAGDTVILEVVRGGEVLSLECTFATAPEEEEDTERRPDPLGYPRPGRHSIGLGGQRENIQDEQGPDGHEFGGVYRSADGGETWQRINSLNPRPMYYSEIRVDPSDSQYVYVLGTSLYRSNDGGATFTSDGGRGIHVDHHALWIDPADGRHMILGNDGGIHVTYSRMDGWDHHNHVAIGQFYNITCDATRDYKIYGGLQDNGSWGGPNRAPDGGILNSDWIRVGGGDGFVCLVDRHDPDLVYYESQNGGMGRTHLRTGEGGFLRPRSGRDERYRFNWNTPFILSHHNSKIYYSAGSHVFRSLDRGEGQRKISPDITATERGAAVALGESPIDPDLLYVGSDDGALWTTRDGGHTWHDLWAVNEGLETQEPVPSDIAAATEERATRVANVASEATDGPKDAAVTDSPIDGTWKAKAEGTGIERDDQGRFTLELALGKDGKVTGSIDSDIGTGPITSGRWDADKSEVSFAFQGPSMRLEIKGKVEDGSMDGTIAGAGGAFSFTFTAEREGAQRATASAAQEPEKTAEDPGAQEPEVAEGEAPDAEAPEGEEPKPKKRKFKEDTIDQLLPGRRYVSNLVPSKYKKERVYATFDGHRADDDAPHVYASDDGGETWESLRGNLPDSAGPVRAFAEDIESRNVLWLGTEFGAWVSIDTGKSWTPLNSDLPTVAVHDLAQHPTSGELIAGTHGRSVWILDVTALRGMSEDSVDADAHLYPVNTVVRWRRGQSRGQGTRHFEGEGPSSGARIYYSIDKKVRGASLRITDAEGNTVYTFENAPFEKGLHELTWSLRVQSQSDDEESEEPRRRFRRRFNLAGPGAYRAELRVNGETYVQELEVVADPTQPDTRWLAYEEWNAMRFDVEEEDGERNESVDDGRRDF